MNRTSGVVEVSDAAVKENEEKDPKIIMVWMSQVWRTLMIQIEKEVWYKKHKSVASKNVKLIIKRIFQEWQELPNKIVVLKDGNKSLKRTNCSAIEEERRSDGHRMLDWSEFLLLHPPVAKVHLHWVRGIRFQKKLWFFVSGSVRC